ncbi:hypothetical protein ACHAWF_005926 [Thalassiosira exigua]
MIMIGGERSTPSMPWPTDVLVVGAGLGAPTVHRPRGNDNNNTAQGHGNVDKSGMQYGSSSTSEKDESGYETGGSKLSCKESLEVGTSMMSSLSGSDEGGLLCKGDMAPNGRGISPSSLGGNAEEELSERVVVRGKSMTATQGGTSPQIKVSFSIARPVDLDKSRDTSGAAFNLIARKRKRSDGCDQGGANSQEPSRKISENTLQEYALENDEKVANSSDSDYTSTRNTQHIKPSVATVSFSSMATMAFGQELSLDALSSKTSPTRTHDQKHADVVSPLLSPKANFKCPQSPKKLDNEERRLERNLKEKERSNRIAFQVDTLRSLLQRGGLLIPKNTRSTILSEATNYIRTLQDRQQLMSAEMEGLKKQLAEAMAERVNSSVMSQMQEGLAGGGGDAQDYHLIFKNTLAGMAVASMGGEPCHANAALLPVSS